MLDPCQTCAGTGESFQVCPACEGIGFEYVRGRVETCELCCGTPVVWIKCPACRGQGSQVAADLWLFAKAVSLPSRRARKAD